MVISPTLLQKIDALIKKVQAPGNPFPHTLLIGEDGKSGTAIARHIAEKMNSKLHELNGTALDRAGDLAGVLSNLEKWDVLLVQDFQKVKKIVREYLKSAMKDFSIEVVVSVAPPQSVKMQIPAFTFIGELPDKNDLPRDIRDLFFCSYELLDLSSKEDLRRLFSRELDERGIKCESKLIEAVAEEAGKSRQTTLISKIIRYADLTGTKEITEAVLQECLDVTEHSFSPEQAVGPDRRISDEVKREVWQRDLGKCVQCGGKEKLEFDHIIPVSKGGSNTARNIQLLCETCNRSKSDSI